MTTPSSDSSAATPAGGGDARPTLAIGALLRANVREFFALLGREWRWLVVFAIYLLGWYTPFTDHGTAGDGPARWCWENWRSINLTLGFTLFIPFLAALVIWVRRAALKEYWSRIVARYPLGHPKRQGSLIPLAIGCFLLFVSHIIEVKGVGVLALVVMFIAVVYRVYGPLMTRALAAPLALLFAMIPLPDHFTDDLCTHKVTNICVKLAAGLLSAVGVHAQSMGTLLHLRGYVADINYQTCCGTGIALSVVLILLTYHLCRNTDPTMIVISFVIGFVLTFTLQIGRIAMIGLLTGPQPELAEWLMNSVFVTLAVIALVSWATVKIMRLSFRARMPQSVMRAAKMTGRGMNAVTGSFDRPAGALMSAGNLWTRSERAIERGFKALSKRRKSKQRNRW